MNPVLKPLPALGRILLSLVFVTAGIRKIGTIAATTATMQSHGIPHSDMLVWAPSRLNSAAGSR